MLELRDSASVEELAAVLRTFASDPGLDRSTRALRERTGPSLDLSNPGHQEALLVWLRSWGCRHLRVADSAMSSRALLRWSREHATALPGPRADLTSLSPRRIARAAEAYGSLARAPAARRVHRDGEVDVTFGETAASKTLYALRPRAFPPWDEPMRRAFGGRPGDPERFARYVELSADALRGLAARLGVPVAALPELLGHPESTPARIVDEYLWVRVTRGGALRS